MNTQRFPSALILISLILSLAGCASGLAVQISAIADPKVTTASTRYIWLNGNAKGQENELFFREFSAYFIPLLTQKGYRRVASRELADIEIFFRYNVSDGRSGIHTFAHPMYETLGGNTISYTETKTDAAGVTTSTRGTLHIPLHTQYIGTRVESHSYTLYTSSAALEAYTVSRPNSENTQPVALWKTLMSSTSISNDLRSIIPVMAAAAAPYITSNSGSAKTVRLKPDDPQVMAIKRQATP